MFQVYSRWLLHFLSVLVPFLAKGMGRGGPGGGGIYFKMEENVERKKGGRREWLGEVVGGREVAQGGCRRGELAEAGAPQIIFSSGVKVLSE